VVEPQLIEDVFVCCTRFLRMYIHCVCPNVLSEFDRRLSSTPITTLITTRSLQDMTFRTGCGSLLIEDVFVCCTRFLRMYIHCVSSRHWPSPLTIAIAIRWWCAARASHGPRPATAGLCQSVGTRSCRTFVATLAITTQAPKCWSMIAQCLSPSSSPMAKSQKMPGRGTPTKMLRGSRNNANIRYP
jgi:hypothetical protein